MMDNGMAEAYRSQYLDGLVLDTFFSGTFREPMIGCDEGFRRLKLFFKGLNKKGEVFYRKFVRGFAVAERQGREESVHLHCVLEGIDPRMMSELKRRWQDAFGNADARVYDYELPGQASDYLARKCAEGSAEGWMPLKINSKWRGEL